MFEKIRNKLFPREAQGFRVDFSRENAKALRFLLFTGLIVCVAAFICSYVLHLEFYSNPRLMEYLLFLAVSVALYIGYRADIIESATFILYLWISLLLLWSILLAAGDPHGYPSFLFSFLILALPLLIRDAWGRVLILTVFFSVLFLIVDYVTRDPQIFLVDLFHIILCAGISIYLSYRQLSERVNSMQASTDAEMEAERDGLTGIYNRRGGEQLIRAYVENGMPGAFMLIDVDDFKYINDNYGHAAGDEALKTVAETLKHCFRESDVVMRMGGDEFIVYAVGMADARHVEEKLAYLKGKLHQITLDDGGFNHVTASIGCVINLGSYPDYDTLSSAADRLLYLVKVEGKDNYKCTDADYKPELDGEKAAEEGKGSENEADRV